MSVIEMNLWSVIWLCETRLKDIILCDACNRNLNVVAIRFQLPFSNVVIKFMLQMCCHLYHSYHGNIIICFMISVQNTTVKTFLKYQQKPKKVLYMCNYVAEILERTVLNVSVFNFINVIMKITVTVKKFLSENMYVILHFLTKIPRFLAKAMH